MGWSVRVEELHSVDEGRQRRRGDAFRRVRRRGRRRELDLREGGEDSESFFLGLRRSLYFPRADFDPSFSSPSTSQPSDRVLRPSTHPNTKSSIRVTSELVVDLYFTSTEPSTSQEKVLIATVLRRPVFLAS